VNRGAAAKVTSEDRGARAGNDDAHADLATPRRWIMTLPRAQRKPCEVAVWIAASRARRNDSGGSLTIRSIIRGLQRKTLRGPEMPRSERPSSVDGFDGALFGQIDGYKSDLLAAADNLERLASQTGAFGQLLTGDVIAQGRQVVESIDVRNQAPLFPPLFLTFLENPEWISRTDAALVRMRRALLSTQPPTPTVYDQFISNAAKSPMGGLFELNVYDVLDRAFPNAIPQPKLTGSKKRGDLRIEIGGRRVYVEATVIDEGQFWRGVERMMHAHGLSVYSTGGPGPDTEAWRVVAKIAEELQQTAPDAANIIAISFFGTFPSDLARQWAFADLFAGGQRYGRSKDGSVVLDLSNLRRVDSIFEFSRARLLNVHVNAHCDPEFRLTDAERDRLRAAFDGATLMIR
jgi:hypothetical protein